MSNVVIRSERVILSSRHTPMPLAIHVRDGVIIEITQWDAVPPGARLHDCVDSVIMPGIVDTHAHINEPGRTEWEGFVTATKAAAAGGITTIIDMPLNSLPPTTTVAALGIKADHARGKCAIDYGFWGGVIPGNTAELVAMVDRGAWGFKAFLCDSGVPEFPASQESDLRAAMNVLAKRNVPLLAHAELEVTHPTIGGNPREYRTYLKSRPPEWEVEAIRLLITLARETGCRVHIVHLSASEALPDIAAARRDGVKLSAETCPHYLTLDADSVPDGATPFKCAPPIRTLANQKALWRGLQDGTLDLIVSDHSPCTPDLKRLESGDFGEAWGGIAGLQFSLSVTWTKARSQGIAVTNLIKWMAEGPAALAGLPRKGTLAVGFDADMVVWNPDRHFMLTPDIVKHRHRVTPYVGKRLDGVVEKTFLRGELAYEEGQAEIKPRGQELKR